MAAIAPAQVEQHLINHMLEEAVAKSDSALEADLRTERKSISLNGQEVVKYINEFWTARQRQANSIHEISYRACFKPQLPGFFINLLTKQGDVVYDPFSGRGTTPIEAALRGRKLISNDVNPLSKILTRPRLFPPGLAEVEKRLSEISFINENNDMDLSMFYHPETEKELRSIKRYLLEKRECGNEDDLDDWIRMTATNRLTGHSRGFFSVYTLPPNQATSPQRQLKINEKRDQKPEYRNTRKLIAKKTKSLIRDLDESIKTSLNKSGETGLFLSKPVDNTPEILDNSVQLIVTSPPFLNVVQYASDNWLRCWFNGIDAERVSSGITMVSNLDKWCEIMGKAFAEFHRIMRPGGWVAFEVGEVNKKTVKLDEYVAPLGIKAGFSCFGIIINRQHFTKTSNIWGVDNNSRGTNSNRIVLFRKE